MEFDELLMDIDGIVSSFLRENKFDKQTLLSHIGSCVLYAFTIKLNVVETIKRKRPPSFEEDTLDFEASEPAKRSKNTSNVDSGFGEYEKRYKCNVCHKGQRDANSLKIHLRIHSGEKPFKCKKCNAAFTANYTLNRHIKKYCHKYRV